MRAHIRPRKTRRKAAVSQRDLFEIWNHCIPVSRRVYQDFYAQERGLSASSRFHIYGYIYDNKSDLRFARPRTLGTLPDDASRLVRDVPPQRLVGLRPPPCVVPPRKPVGFRQRAETRKPPTRHAKDTKLCYTIEHESTNDLSGRMLRHSWCRL